MKNIIYIGLLILSFILPSFVYALQLDAVDKYVIHVNEQVYRLNHFSDKLRFIRNEENKIRKQGVNNIILSETLINRLDILMTRLQKDKYTDPSYLRERIYTIDNSLYSEQLFPISKLYSDESFTGDVDLSIFGGVSVRTDIIQPLNDMNDSYKESHNGNRIHINSGYRSLEEQEKVFEKEGDDNLASPPGQSEHQTGYAVDFQTNGDIWFSENATKFGFIRSFTDECYDKTGINNEPWHYRWIGIDNVNEFNESGRTCIIDFLRYKTGLYPKEIRTNVITENATNIETNDSFVTCIYKNLTNNTYKNLTSVLYDGVCQSSLSSIN